MNVEHDESGSRFVVRLEGEEADLVYSRIGSKLIDLQHTYVPESWRRRSRWRRLRMRESRGFGWCQRVRSCDTGCGIIRRN